MCVVLESDRFGLEVLLRVVVKIDGLDTNANQIMEFLSALVLLMAFKLVQGSK